MIESLVLCIRKTREQSSCFQCVTEAEIIRYCLVLLNLWLVDSCRVTTHHIYYPPVSNPLSLNDLTYINISQNATAAFAALAQ